MDAVTDINRNGPTDALIRAAVQGAVAELRAAGLRLPPPGRLPPGEKVDRLSYTVNEACTALGIGRTSLYELVKNGELTLVKVAGRSLVRRAELERLLGLNQPVAA